MYIIHCSSLGLHVRVLDSGIVKSQILYTDTHVRVEDVMRLGV